MDICLREVTEAIRASFCVSVWALDKITQNHKKAYYRGKLGETVKEPHLFQKERDWSRMMGEAPMETWACCAVWLSASKPWLAQGLEEEEPR